MTRPFFIRLVAFACAVGALAVTGCQSGSVRPDPAATAPLPAVQAEQPSANAAGGSLSSPSRPRDAAPAGFRHTSVPVNGPYIALTFDDGPNAALTPQLLDILKEREVQATFFVVGQRVRPGRTILQRMVAEGHEIGNHGWDHSALDRLSRSAARDQLMRTSYAIWAAVGEFPALMRPPYGRTDAGLNRWIFEDMGMRVILWSVDSLDWRHKDAGRVEQEILAGAQPGAIILCHDIQPSTIAAMPATLERLQAKGFRFVTVSELLALEWSAGE